MSVSLIADIARLHPWQSVLNIDMCGMAPHVVMPLCKLFESGVGTDVLSLHLQNSGSFSQQ